MNNTPQTNPQKIILFLTRVIFGLLFLEAGLNKLLSDFSADQFLTNASGPFSDVFTAMAGNNLVDFLVIFGEIGIGLGLIFGIFMWLVAAGGIIMMVLYYLAGFPPETGYINLNIIYIFVFLLLAFFHAEDYWGLEKRWRKLLPQEASENNRGNRTFPEEE